MNLKFSRALVTGGAGFIGSHLVDGLLSKGCQVTVIDDLSTGRLSNLGNNKDHITFYRADIRDQQALEKAAKHCDIIFHQAAVVSVPRTVDNPVDSAMVNEMGTLFVLEAARKNNVKRVVFASSSAVYGDDPVLPKHENMNFPENSMPVSTMTSMELKPLASAILMFMGQDRIRRLLTPVSSQFLWKELPPKNLRLSMVMEISTEISYL